MPRFHATSHSLSVDRLTIVVGFVPATTASILVSKVGMPSGSMNPITHGFLEYMKRDPAFVVNRFRWGGLGVTFNMDETGLAKALAAMGTNTGRVLSIFKHLDEKHNSDADDVAVRYLEQAKGSPDTLAAIKANPTLVALLIRIMDEGPTGRSEDKAIEFLRAL